MFVALLIGFGLLALLAILWACGVVEVVVALLQEPLVWLGIAACAYLTMGGPGSGAAVELFALVFSLVP
ncbi:MAG: hypothetical protein H0T73_07735 [Ardenticatenales bacterium]|nr:hypothetical protein [Ardenticatenales bacterium]